MSYIPTPIKSIQQVAIACGGLSAVATISPVIVGASLLIYQGHQSQDAGGALNFDDFAYGLLTNPTTVTVAKQGNGALGGQVVWNGMVVEFLQNFVKSQGSGTIAIPDGSASATVTIPSVNTGKTILVFTGQSNANNVNTGRMNALCATVALTNGTTITAARLAAAVTLTGLLVGYHYLEFK